MRVVFVKEFFERVSRIGRVRYPVGGEYGFRKSKAECLIADGYAIDPLNPPEPEPEPEPEPVVVDEDLQEELTNGADAIVSSDDLKVG